jgi:hypothetical protein
MLLHVGDALNLFLLMFRFVFIFRNWEGSNAIEIGIERDLRVQMKKYVVAQSVALIYGDGRTKVEMSLSPVFMSIESISFFQNKHTLLIY